MWDDRQAGPTANGSDNGTEQSLSAPIHLKKQGGEAENGEKMERNANAVLSMEHVCSLFNNQAQNSCPVHCFYTFHRPAKLRLAAQCFNNLHLFYTHLI